MPLHPGVYAHMLGEKMQKHKVNVWLINTGWTGGSYGTGQRMKLSYTRTMIKAALENKFENIEFENDPVFGVAIPKECPSPLGFAREGRCKLTKRPSMEPSENEPHAPRCRPLSRHLAKLWFPADHPLPPDC